MSTASVLARARLAAQNLMVDACSIGHVTGWTTDDTTGVISPNTTTIYTGPCRVQQRTAASSENLVGEASLRLLTIEVQLPVVGTETVAQGDQITITAALHDVALVGRMFVVQGEAHKTHASARRLACNEVTS